MDGPTCSTVCVDSLPTWSTRGVPFMPHFVTTALINLFHVQERGQLGWVCTSLPVCSQGKDVQTLFFLALDCKGARKTTLPRTPPAPALPTPVPGPLLNPRSAPL